MQTVERMVVAVEGTTTQFQLFFTKSCGCASLAHHQHKNTFLHLSNFDFEVNTFPLNRAVTLPNLNPNLLKSALLHIPAGHNSPKLFHLFMNSILYGTYLAHISLLRCSKKYISTIAQIHKSVSGAPQHTISAHCRTLYPHFLRTANSFRVQPSLTTQIASFYKKFSINSRPR